MYFKQIGTPYQYVTEKKSGIQNIESQNILKNIHDTDQF